MIEPTSPILYVKPGCPWCDEVVQFLNDSGIHYREVNVITTPSAMVDMKSKSGQSKVPTLDWHGKVLADFGVDELIPFLRDQNVTLRPRN
jgi:glutaredoxin 3